MQKKSKLNLIKRNIQTYKKSIIFMGAAFLFLNNVFELPSLFTIVSLICIYHAVTSRDDLNRRQDHPAETVKCLIKFGALRVPIMTAYAWLFGFRIEYLDELWTDGILLLICMIAFLAEVMVTSWLYLSFAKILVYGTVKVKTGWKISLKVFFPNLLLLIVFFLVSIEYLSFPILLLAQVLLTAAYVCLWVYLIMILTQHEFREEISEKKEQTSLPETEARQEWKDDYLDGLNQKVKSSVTDVEKLKLIEQIYEYSLPFTWNQKGLVIEECVTQLYEMLEHYMAEGESVNEPEMSLKDRISELINKLLREKYKSIVKR